MIVHVDAESPVPVFEQLRSQIERIILAGGLAAEDRLPTVRNLANDLGLARGTVNKVYDALSRDGLVETRGRLGTFVRATRTDGRSGSSRVGAAADLDASADGLALVAVQLGLNGDATHAALDRALRRLATDPSTVRDPSPVRESSLNVASTARTTGAAG